MLLSSISLILRFVPTPVKDFFEISLILLPDLILDYLFDGIEVVVLEDIILETFELFITVRTTMMPIDRFFNAAFAVNMATSRDIAIVDGIETHRALKLWLKPLWADADVLVLLACWQV